MKVFVIGATGMAGSAFVKKAVEKNIEVIANGRSLEKLKQLKKKFPQIRILAKNSFDLQKNDFSDSDAILNAPTSSFGTQIFRHLCHNKMTRIGVFI